MKKFFKDFSEFIKRGNVIDLAVAVIIGGAFGKIVTSLVNHIIMPVISMFIGEKGFHDFKYVIKPADEFRGTAENAIYWGTFIQNIIDFLIVAFVIFVIIRIFNRAQKVARRRRLEEIERQKKLEEEKLAQQPKKPTVEELLSNIEKLLEKNLNK